MGDVVTVGEGGTPTRFGVGGGTPTWVTVGGCWAGGGVKTNTSEYGSGWVLGWGFRVAHQPR
jgi:hypothetical protein